MVVLVGLGQEGVRSSCLMDTEIQFGKMKSIGDGWRRWLHNNMNTFNAAELYS